MRDRSPRRAPGRNGTEYTNKRKRVGVLWLCNAVELSRLEGDVGELEVDEKLIFIQRHSCHSDIMHRKAAPCLSDIDY
jgi:hypothetical protein